ncbi:MAG TPA: GNAT family N-acetyltransferase [Clostridia bacterium]|nr:GNAT family N-acetyltransferase [Clostridia bacterium]
MKAQKKVGEITLRTCHVVDEFRQALDLQRRVWNFSDIEMVPIRLFVVGEKIGGHVLGAFDGDRMVGFAYGLPGIRGRHSYIHSHMLAVEAEYRNLGLGRALKIFQREIALAQNIDLIEWTFDPLEIKNAHLNIERLGAIARRYNVNQYGITSSPLQGGLPSDRFVAEWWLRSKRVETALSTGVREPIATTQAVDVPVEISAWKASATEKHLAADVQRRNRETFQRAFTDGLAVLGYQRDAKGNGRFLLARWDEGWGYGEEEREG